MKQLTLPFKRKPVLSKEEIEKLAREAVKDAKELDASLNRSFGYRPFGSWLR